MPGPDRIVLVASRSLVEPAQMTAVRQHLEELLATEPVGSTILFRAPAYEARPQVLLERLIEILLRSRGLETVMVQTDPPAQLSVPLRDWQMLEGADRLVVYACDPEPADAGLGQVVSTARARGVPLELVLLGADGAVRVVHELPADIRRAA